MTKTTKQKLLGLLLVSFFLTLGYVLFCTRPDLKANQIFVRFSLLIILGIFGLTFVFFKRPKVVRIALLSILGMSAFSFALVPIYDVFCDVTGLNGKIDLSVIAATPKGITDDREITVEMVVNFNQEMPWDFKPQHHKIVVHPGELARTGYFAKNKTKRTMVAQAIPSISPSRASRYLKKVECFCFNSQQLGPGETANLGLQFYLDPDLPKDISRLTLSYTLFDVTKDHELLEQSNNHHG